MILHLVLFQPKPGLSESDRQAFAGALRLATSLPGVKRARVGRSVDIGIKYAGVGDKPYEFVALLEFDGLSDLQAYLNDPLHADLGRRFWLACESTMILDAHVADVSDSLDHLLED